MSTSEEDILLEKMSTKICQLTRVVYLLNNKYLDAQSNIESIKPSSFLIFDYYLFDYYYLVIVLVVFLLFLLSY